MSNKKSNEDNRIRDKFIRIESLISSIDKEADNIRQLGSIYRATSVEEHKNSMVSKLDSISRENHKDLYDINSKSLWEIEDYRSSNEHLLSDNCELFEEFWTNPLSKGLRSLELFFQAHYFLNCFSDEYYNYFEYEKLLKSCGCLDK